MRAGISDRAIDTLTISRYLIYVEGSQNSCADLVIMGLIKLNINTVPIVCIVMHTDRDYCHVTSQVPARDTHACGS